jgi:glycosyltransferase involved in cell wall biosynthesis
MVTYFHRKRTHEYFSIESLFANIRGRLPNEIVPKVKVLSYVSNGFLRRLYISFEAMLNQGDINHVTGDIHFITLFLNRKKTVLTIHDLGFLKYSNGVSRFILKLFWVTLPARCCAAITVVSESTKAELIKFLAKKYHRKIKVIHNPIDEKFKPSAKVFNSDRPEILQIGTKENKNLFRLIEALSGIPCRFQIVGSLSPAIKKHLENHKIDYSSYTDLTAEEIVERYHSADIVAFVSTLEGFGLPIIEGNAVGRVVITSNMSSMPEVAGDAACLVDPLNVESIRLGFLKVIVDNNYREDLIAKGFVNSSRFKVLKIASQYADLYYTLRK